MGGSSGLGGLISSLFGGGYDEPSVPETTPLPQREEEAEPVSRAVRDAEQRKLRARRGMSGTLLTSPLGTTGGSSNNGLLGRTL